MAVYLDEDFVGSDASELVFPHLLLCMGVACQMNDGRLVGCHISNATTEAEVLAELQKQINANGGTPRLMYMIANFSEHFLHSKLTFTQKARTLGYLGNIYTLDTKPVVKKDGAFAQVISTGGSAACNVYISADEDARPYKIAQGKTYTGGQIVELNNGTAIPPRWVKTGHNTSLNLSPASQSDFKIARCN